MPRLRFLLLLAGSCLLVIAGCARSSLPPAARTTPAPAPRAIPAGPTGMPGAPVYHVAGTKIVDAHGTVFIPSGVWLLGLANTNWRQSQGFSHLTYDQMVAAHTIWHANTVGIKLASAALFAVSPYDGEYLNKIDQEVSWANALGMNVLFGLQYQNTTQQQLPTTDSVRFWTFLATHYKNDPQVFFEVFNEPDANSAGPDGWSIWRNGGEGYVGFQQLVDTVRDLGAENLIFADGLASGESLNLAPSYQLDGPNIIYAVHPYLNATQHLRPDQWDDWWGRAAATLPVVVDEWGEYQSGEKGECIPQAPVVVPQFLAYLQQRGIGLIAWSLFPGVLIRGWDYATPTAFDQEQYACTGTFPNFDLHAQGAGQLIARYFAANASP